MLLSLSGASGAGKSTVLGFLQQLDWGQPVTCAEFDSIGVPVDADTAWRHAAIEQWVRRALEEQARGCHLLLCGQVPVGELLAAPSADELDGVAVCVLHCSPEVRRDRLRRRGEPEETITHHVAFGEWFLRHAMDLGHRPEVVRVDSPVRMRWERWEDWQGDGARWPVAVVNTDASPPEQIAARVGGWARDALRQHGQHAGHRVDGA
jgi:hypothetical protein